MPPKKGRGKTAAEEEPEAPPAKVARTEASTSAPAAAAAAAAKAAGPTPRAKVDQFFGGGATEVYQDEDGNNWAVNLNQTNIGANNNKYYIIQVVKTGASSYCCFTRWGRVGEPGQNAKAAGSLDVAKKTFNEKFKDKTGNKWDDIRLSPGAFVKKDGKYAMIDIALDDEAAPTVMTITPAAAAGGAPAGPARQVVVRPSELHAKLQEMLRIIFDKDMFKTQLAEMKIDASKMPLGKLTKAQVEKGYKVLEQIDALIKAGSTKKSEYDELSGAFYTTIPHDFGRSVPPAIRDSQTLASKFELLNVLADIQVATAMDSAAESGEAEINPLDKQYSELNCQLQYVDPSSEEYAIVAKYTEETQGYRKCRIMNVFKMDRPQDRQRAAQFAHLGNRRLLWHGTNIAVVAAILKTGLRLMPHAGGRVGKGLYFASENGKSAAYVRPDPTSTIGFMFLNEIILGNPREINQDDSSLTQHKVEKTFGVDSIIARGRTEPDPSKDVTIPGEWGPITVPQGKPIPQPQWHNSTFSQSEYLVYDEGKVRMKYILQMKF